VRGRASNARQAAHEAARSEDFSMAAILGRGSDRATRGLEKAALAERPQHYLLRLYVTGTTPASARAIERVSKICEERLQGRYELEVIDIYQKPALAKDEQIIATPTLVRVLPAPLRRFIGDLSKVDRILFGLDLREKT
jgi:circadian clock protein KaiB